MENEFLQILIDAGWTYWYPEENHYFKKGTVCQNQHDHL